MSDLYLIIYKKEFERKGRIIDAVRASSINEAKRKARSKFSKRMEVKKT